MRITSQRIKLNTSTSRLLTISKNSSCLSKVCMPSLPSVMHNILRVASSMSILFEYIIKLNKKERVCLLYCGKNRNFSLESQITLTHFVIYGTCKDSSYNSVAIFGTAPIFLQSISQNLAETVVVNDTLSFMKVSGVEPVTSSHCASFVPPEIN